jgi:hypothetical protein
MEQPTQEELSRRRYFMPQFDCERCAEFVATNKWSIVEEAEFLVQKWARKRDLLREFRNWYDEDVAKRDEGVEVVVPSLSTDAEKNGVDLMKSSRREYRSALRHHSYFLAMRLNAMTMAHCDRSSRKWLRECVESTYLSINAGRPEMEVIDCSEFGDLLNANDLGGGGKYTEVLRLLISEIVHRVRLDYFAAMSNRMEYAMDHAARRYDALRRSFAASAPPPAAAAAAAAAVPLWSLGLSRPYRYRGCVAYT